MKEYVRIIYNEGRLDDLLKICDYYHPEIPNKTAAFEWGLTLGEYIGRFRPNSSVYRFEMLDGKTVLYFIGTSESIRSKISKML